MKAALLTLGLLGSQTFMVSDSIPHLNVEALCRSTVADDKAMGLALAQSFDGCMGDETAAQKQLAAVWQASAGPVRDQCEGEAIAGGFQSYVDLLTCLQLADSVSPASSAASLRGASKNRNMK